MTGGYSQGRKGLALLSLLLLLWLLGFGPFHVHHGHDGWSHDSSRCAICMANLQLAHLATALLVLPFCLFVLPRPPGRTAPLTAASAPSGLPLTRGPPKRLP